MNSQDLFHPLVWQWFVERFGRPTEPQASGWPSIARGENTLIAAPTGSGKTLAAFLICLDRLVRQWLDGSLTADGSGGVQVVYVSPLKALSNDIQRNLEGPLAELRELAAAQGLGELPIEVAVRTGDTPAKDRQAMIKRPPHILVTTPESLYILITSAKGRERLRTVNTVIVDEIHALARDKRGSHLTLTLERLAHLCERPPVRIGLSATQRPIERIAEFLVGGCSPRRHGGTEEAQREEEQEKTRTDEAIRPTCRIVDVGHVRDLTLAVETPPSELSAVCSLEQWEEVYGRLVELIQSHRSTLIFVNTRRMAERIAFRLRDVLGEEAVASHHGSLARPTRLSAEQRLKNGQLKAIVATASLELGIDIGYVDLVCQIGSPRCIATFLQRIGRSGHSLGATPHGRIFPLTRDELIETMALVRAVRERQLDAIEIPIAPLDILAQQIVAEVATAEWDEGELFNLCRRAWPYRDLPRSEFDAILHCLSEGLTPTTRRGQFLHRDRINGRLRPRKSARLAAITSGGAIPEAAEYRVVTEDEHTFVGTVDEDFAIDSMAGDVFLLGTASWRIRYVRGGEVVVQDAHGAPPSIPFWLGEGRGRTIELSEAISRLRREIAERAGGKSDVLAWLQESCEVSPAGAEQAVRYIQAESAALGLVPSKRQIVFERFFDESGGMQLVIHAPLGSRINRAWGLALRKRFCRSFDFELQAAATENAILLSIGPQHSFPIDQLFKMLGPHNGRELLEQAVLVVPVFQVRWRWNATRALAVLRFQNGTKVPPHLQKFRSNDLLAAAFPETVGCLENHAGDVVIPDHPLVRQTMHDCLQEAMDIEGWLSVLEDVKAGRIELVARDTREPSPFCHEILNANPYAFLDDAPLEERRTRAVQTRRTLSVDDFRDLAKLDPEAIEQVRQEAWPTVRDAEELHDALLSLVVVLDDEMAAWSEWLPRLVEDGRAVRVRGDGEFALTSAAEKWPAVRAVYPAAVAEQAPRLPESLEREWSASEGWVEIVRGRMQHSGPVTAEQLAERLQLEPAAVFAALESLEGQGIVLRGQFSESAQRATNGDASVVQWCERRLLARIHRLTLQELRKRIQPVATSVFLRFLARHQRLTEDRQWRGALGVREAIAQLQGFESPAGAWEQHVLARRIADYDTQWLDQLFLSGEAMWGRLRPPPRDAKNGRGMAAMTRTMPISLLLRENLPWLLPAERTDVSGFATSNAADVHGALIARGALFFQDLKATTGLLAAQVEDALRELTALGLITSDAFAAVRAIVSEKRTTNGRRFGRATTAGALPAPAGRWSPFPGSVSPPERLAVIEHWCRLLLRRYGVVFRDLTTRESAAPPWWELVSAYRRMELRGEVRGGRFVAGVAGEQFATEEAVQALRNLREQPPETTGLVISAADPLNLCGVLTAGPRVPATHRNALYLLAGRFVAARQADQVEFFDDTLAVALRADIRRALLTGGRTHHGDLRDHFRSVAQSPTTIG